MATNTVISDWMSSLDSILVKSKNEKIKENGLKIAKAKTDSAALIKTVNKQKADAVKSQTEANKKKIASNKVFESAREKLKVTQEDNAAEKKRLERVKSDINKNINLIQTYTDAVRLTSRFKITWKDRKSGARLSGAFYRPQPDEGYIAVGDYGQSNYGKTNGSILTIKMNGPIKWKYPVSYTRIWKDSGSGASWDGSFWRPNPPKGYVAVGMCCQRGHGKAPGLKEIACIRKDFAELTKPKSLIWNDRKSGANRSVSIYYNEKVGTLFAQANYSKLAANCFWTLNDKALAPVLEAVPELKSLDSTKRVSATSKSVFGVKSLKNAALSTAELGKSLKVSVIKHKTTMTQMDSILAKLEKEANRK